MGSYESEQDRLKRIRDQQIRARDPQIKERKISRQISAQQKKRRQRDNFILEAIRDVSHKAKGLYMGAVLGLITLLVLPYFLEGRTATILGIAAVPLFMLIGFFVGSSFDWRDDLRDHIN